MTVVASKYVRRDNDLYETEPWAARALLRHFPVVGWIVWEPAAGNHKLADVIQTAGASVVTSDVVTYDRTHDYILDFLKPVPQFIVPPCSAIITNPPYGPGNRDAAAFARFALARCDGAVALLMTAKFDFGNTRTDLFRDNPRFAAKIALIDRIQWFEGEHGGTEDHAWYVWGPLFSGPPRMLYEGKP